MKHSIFKWIALAGALFGPLHGQAQVSCVRGGLQHAVDLYIEAQTKGDISGMPLAERVGYWENTKLTDINQGLIRTPLKVDHHRSVLDESSGQTVAEVIVTDREKPYVI